MNPDPHHHLLRRRATLNPYRQAAILAWERLRWDLHPRAWRARKQLASWGDRFAGQRAVILCNGPSLLESNLDLLAGSFTFGLNKINLLFPTTSFRPSCIVAVNPLVIAQQREFFNTTELPLFLDAMGSLAGITHRSNTFFIHSTSALGFARDCTMSLHQGSTVTYAALQLAFFMGFSKVALIGCDHSFVTTGTPHATVAAGSTDPNHFAPDYFSGGQPWQLPDLPGSEMAYILAREVYQAAGRRLVNATVGGALELLPRVTLEEFVS